MDDTHAEEAHWMRRVARRVDIPNLHGSHRAGAGFVHCDSIDKRRMWGSGRTPREFRPRADWPVRSVSARTCSRSEVLCGSNISCAAVELRLLVAEPAKSVL